MKPVCEVMVMEVLPGIRAMVARKLVEKHGFSQKVAAEKLGTTQPAISQYKRELRGSRMKSLENTPRLIQMIDSIASKAASGKLSHDEINSEFCSVCRFMRSSGLACEFHRRRYPWTRPKNKHCITEILSAGQRRVRDEIY
jgi:predicted transcriptional regulator